MTTQQPPTDLPSIPALLAWRASHTPDWPAAQVQETGGWRSLDWGEVARRSEAYARALLVAGVEPGDRVAIWSRTRLEWSLLDFAVLSVGAVSVGLYPSLAPAQALQQLQRADCKLLFVEHSIQALPLAHQDLRIICLDEPAPDSGHQGLGAFLTPFADIPPERVRQRWQALNRDALANLVFTSGTTGEPKAAMLSHGNLLASISAYPLPPQRYTGLAFLPMAHVGERVIGHYQRLWCGAQAAFVPDINDVPRALAEVRPDFFGSVPRLYEKLHGAAMAQRDAMPAGKRRLLDWALRTGLQQARGERQGGLALLLARRLVLDKLRQRLFGARIQVLVSGGAPLDPQLVEFFSVLGLPLCEGWGMSESTAFLTSNEGGRDKAGSVGRAVPGVELRIADDGEVLARGPLVFQGYFRNPEKTAETFTQDGWLRSGDLGRLDDQGYLWLTGRKKEIIITAGGKNIAPAPIEARLKQHPLVDQALVHGDRRKYLSALLALDPQLLEAWARRNDLPGGPADWLQAPILLADLQAHVDAVNAELSQVERLKAWALLPRPLSQEQDELTPTQKLKRPVVERRFAELLDGMYG
ncbi:long-chain fatty acid--CoA ligase [Metapseudomonas resinovorans]|uniref:Putative fatty-acid--CoA ligase n=1 Tax=Metapseudomonas resinovorans NBRC 106553 TaxID=1245471 RepID=S6AVK4_METRE|nr:AMP-dependent synthetase/ligase [Pseudomonas resinovorans]BAN50293.1 putative fatty-acid--CoA ligase [Pseudomonas resinovorans NBRC 106553]